ncbi:hypothetical protein I6I97_17305 [Sphingobacterium multivorum]|uniref:hypothetical protein n=1 Tax=Sphingobacterium multivorum TaxID=28454 RepID=UPI001917F83F|nr:hypothetical protein [Sphingobacterium multivorum]QQT60958.1 hypothetical protein I6I97_17305 [Sphingobacterium multivorum]
MSFLANTLEDLGFSRYEWSDEEVGTVIDHKFENENFAIEITNLQTVEITTKGQYVELPSIDNDQKLQQLINLLTK